MKARDKVALAVYRSALGAIDNAEAPDASITPSVEQGVVAGGVVRLRAGEVSRRELSGADVERVVRLEIEERHATALALDGAGQDERAALLRVEASHLERLLDGS